MGLVSNASAAVGFTIKGDQLIDANGNAFVIRGVNHPHAWFSDKLQSAIPEIAKTGANSVRVVMATGGQWTRTSASQVRQIINICKANKMIAVLEVHDCTGYGEKAEAKPLSTAVDYWLSADIKAELDGQEAYVILNIANEPFGNNVTPDTYINEHKTAVKRLRDGGYKHNIMIDAANWGQDWEGTMRDRADEILAADSDKNLIFSVHMYDQFNTASKVKAYLNTFKTAGLPLLVGEFAADHGPGKDVDEATIMSQTTANKQGYMGWSWTGNNKSDNLQSLDIVEAWGGALTPWGKTLVDGPYGLRATSQLASIFTVPDGKKLVLALVQGQGTITATATGRVDSGMTNTFKAVPTAGHEFVGWSGDTAGTQISGTTLVIPKVEKDYTIQANFAPGAGKNLIKGGSFAGPDSASWVLGLWPTPANNGSVSYANAEAKITITATDTTDYGVQLRQGGFQIDRGATYEVSFDANASVARDLNITLTTEGWNWQSNSVIAIGTTKKSYTVDLTADTTTATGMIQFCVGKALSTVTIDNVTLVRKGGTSVRPRSFAASAAALSLRSVANGFEWVRATPLSSAATVRVVNLQGVELFRTTAKAGSTTGFVPSVGTGLRFVVLETAQARDVRTLNSTR